MIGNDRRNLGKNAADEIETLNSLSSSFSNSAPMPSDPRIPLHNLSLLGQKMDSLSRFLSNSVDLQVPIGSDQLHLVSCEIASAIQEVIINGSALLASTQLDVAKPIYPQSNRKPSDNPIPPRLSAETVADADTDIVEIDAAELMVEHVHFCDICGKGFRRDANLRMHMRAHGDRFKTLESLTKPGCRSGTMKISSGRRVRFSCPFPSCRRNRNHARFRSLKTAACVRNHFRRSHYPKMYTCDVCNKKNFSVMADLKSHIKSCGDSQWRCSCGTSFSRKDKLFGHISLFDGHFPVVGAGVEKREGVVIGSEINDKREGQAGESLDEGFFDGVIEEIGGMGGVWMET